MIDYHLHTNHSCDADPYASIMNMVDGADKLGITHLAICDHMDFYPDGRYTDFIIKDLSNYIHEIEQARSRFKHISIARGIEIGYIYEAKDKIKQVLDSLEPDFVISSNHIINGIDPYHEVFFHDKSRDEAYREYIECKRDSVDNFDKRTSVLGHIGYAVRYGIKNGHYDNPQLQYKDYPELIDELLMKVINRGIGLELNTSNYNYSNEPMPPASIINRYKQLGGEILTIGSDAHKVCDIGQHYDKGISVAKAAGFKYVAVYKKLKPSFIKI